MPGTIARDVFAHHMGEDRQSGKGVYSAYLAVVFNPDAGEARAFYGTKRRYAETGSVYWSVITKAAVRANSIDDYAWYRLHGRVIARHRRRQQ
jgi:hypothetical protein